MSTRIVEVSATETLAHEPTLQVLLIEADPTARARHEAILSSAGYLNTALAVCVDPRELLHAAVVLADVRSFEWLQQQRLRRLPPVVVLAADERAGVTACLCGAAAWSPLNGAREYLLDTVGAVIGATSARGSRPLSV